MSAAVPMDTVAPDPETVGQLYDPSSKRKNMLALQEERDVTGLKNIFQKQLPKMPKEYIARLVYDRNHFSMAVVRKDPLKVLGGIAYRPFSNRRFAEIVFCAIDSTEQVKGYGSRLMSHVKDYVRHAHDVHYFLTYADNYAIGYFKKQGFTTDITLEKCVWMGYIKDYEGLFMSYDAGGTIMQCSMIPKVTYLDAYEIIMAQRKAVFDKIYQVTHSSKVYPGIKINLAHPLDPESIPGLKEAGFTKFLEESTMGSRKAKSPVYIILKKMVTEAAAHNSAWPFLQPVTGVPDYYDVIKEPMDLRTLDERVEVDMYESIEAFDSDLTKIFVNCRSYNTKESNYFKCAIKLEKFCRDRLLQLRKEANQ